ncbi:MAG: glucose-6-phosphate isomerase [Rhodospirillaceae bacterium]|nr:glucose-6-phosphate isomerase [Rhodospirillaceae bacterium]
MTGHPLTTLPAWQALETHAAALRETHLRDLFAGDPDRFARFSFSLGPLLADYSKNRVTAETMGLLMELARARNVEAGRAAMFAGAHINTTEKRAVLHVALRNRAHRPMTVDGVDVMPEVQATRARLKKFSDDVRHGAWLGATGNPIRHIVNIGIGGSHLGPMFVADALKDHQRADLSVAFVSNPDRAQIDEVLTGLDASATLFVVASKTFTTAETMFNAHLARTWIVEALGEAALPRHFAAISTNRAAAGKFGISKDAVFPMWDWVGGRYSVWSAIGLPVMLACGYEVFDQFLAGAEAMDRHFETASLDQNLPVILAMIGLWHADFLGAAAMAVLPYDYRLKLLPSHLQQVDMESNGKGVMTDGVPAAGNTGPIVFGGGGSDSQHSFYQLLHQGPRMIPCDFIGALKGADGMGPSRDLLLSNMFAQSEALMKGRAAADLASTPLELQPHRSFSGNRPSTTLLLEELTPYTLGMLMALYEHKVFVQGLVWGVNSFDQWGVELGKELATSLEPALNGAALKNRDSSTAGLVAAYLHAKGGAA